MGGGAVRRIGSSLTA